MMRLALDGTPLLGFRSGIGEVVAGIAHELARRPDVELVAYALTLRGRNELAASLPPGTRSATRPYPARLVRQAWLHSEMPGIERWTGPVDVVHGTNYVAPPTKAGEVVSVYDLGFLRYPEFVAADALDYPELLRRAIRRGAWIHTTSDFVRDEVVATFPVPAERVVRVYPGVPPVRGGDAANGHALGGNDAVRARGRDHRAAQELPGAGTGVRRARRRRPRPPARGRRARGAGAAPTSTPRSPPPATATVCTRPGTCRPPTAPTCSQAPRSSPSPRTTRGSASRPSRPWPPTSRWWRPAPVPSPRSSATPHSWSIPTTPTRWPTRCGRC